MNVHNIPVVVSVHSTPVWGVRIVGGMGNFETELSFARHVISMVRPKLLIAANDVYAEAAVKASAGNITSSLGVASGSLEAQGIGEQGFGWDAYFVPTGSYHTYAEMGSNKHSTSSRAKAATQVAKKLR